jgi:Flp pilus assembly protein TadG
MSRLRRFAARLARDDRGLALLEFAFSVPILLLLSLTGAELLNYTTTRMRVSQMALQIADNAARMGKGTQITAKVISETDINDLFTGAQLQSGELNLNANGRVILSDIEPMANPNTTFKYKIGWQRCYGSKTTHPSSYGTTGQTNLDGVGPTGQQITAQDDNATMFVEVYYVYTPIIAFSRAPSTTMIEVASMAIRDRRDLTQIYNTENAPIATC